MRKIDTIAVHCAATTAGMDIGVKEIRQWHLAKAWSDIGYHFIIRRGGAVETGRPLEKTGAHVSGHNSHSIGICLVGGLDANGKPECNFSDGQFDALATLIAKLKKQFPGISTIQGHRDFPGVHKACPCFDVKKWLAGETEIQDFETPDYQDAFWGGIEHFKPGEFGGEVMDMDYIRKLDVAREAAGVPFIVEQTISDHEVVVRIAG